MAWTETARAKYRRSTERFESDLPDTKTGVGFTRALGLRAQQLIVGFGSDILERHGPGACGSMIERAFLHLLVSLPNRIDPRSDVQ